MSAARTPVHSYYVDADFNVCYGSQIMEPLEIVATIETLTAENAALREALRACITDEGAHCYQTGSVHAFDCRIKGINAEARAALAIAGRKVQS